MNTYTPDDVERIQELVGALRGSQLHELDGYLRENREGVLRVAQDVARSTSLSCPPAACIARLRKGEHRRKVRAMSTNEGGTGHERVLVPAAEAMRRLYDAKMIELQRYGVPERDRIPIAVDYACGEVHRCHIQPMPPGGVTRLEDDLYRALGYDRVTGVRFPPESHA